MMSATTFRSGTALQHQRRQPAPRRGALKTQALFNLFAPAKAAKASPNQRAQELVSELLELTERTDGGLNASASKRQQIEELVEELQGFCPRNPLRSPLLWGDYEVLYASKPQTAGGPFRSPLGRTVFPGQRALQILQEPNICINEVTYKTLGFIPGTARQEGEFTPVSSDTFQLDFPRTDDKKGGRTRLIQVVYLDDRIRVARFVPPEEDEEAEPSFYVFRRLVEEEEEEEEVYEEVEEVEAPAAPKRALFSFGGTRKMKVQDEEEEEEEEAPAPRRSMFGTQLLGRKEGLATMAEKRYAQQAGSRGTAATGTTSTRAGTGTMRKSREEIAAERAAAKAAAEEQRQAAREAAAAAKAAAEEERRAAREAAAAAKAAAEEERRQRQAQLEAERARIAELKEAAKEQLTELQGEAADAADEAKEAAAALKEAEKAAAALLQQASQARGLIDQAAAAAMGALQQLEAIKQQEKEATAEVAEARGTLKELEAATRRRK